MLVHCVIWDPPRFVTPCKSGDSRGFCIALYCASLVLIPRSEALLRVTHALVMS